MAIIKQLVYNYESAGSAPIYYDGTTQLKTENAINNFLNILTYNEKKQDIIRFLLENETNKKINIIKLGIQAPPGQKFYLGDQQLVIGRTGVYELDNNITTLQAFYFQQEPVWNLDEAKTIAAQNEAVTQFKSLENNNFPKQVDNTEGWNEEVIIGNETITEFKLIEDWVTTYQSNDAKFKAGYLQYLKGKYGVYEPVENAYQDLKNIIVDIIYTKETDTNQNQGGIN